MLTAMVTGASSGIGRATSLELGRRGYHVIAAGRSPRRVGRVVAAIIEGGGSAEPSIFDLGSLVSTAEAAERLADLGRDLDVLVNNAGVGGERGVTDDGFEIHFGVNHLGHFLLTRQLAASLRTGSRVVTVSSEMHRRVDGVDFEALIGPGRSFLGLREYAVSKLANILFTRELARLRPDLACHAVHPGLANTRIIPGYLRPFLALRILTAEEAADTVLWCVTSVETAAESGRYFSRREAHQPSPAARDEGLASELWHRSEIWCEAVTGR
jgi:NAD(P)-dependent dehydrogenase (short-subunit alcohol dehydrogenase family)